jgi:hypothetical protein
VSRSKFSAQPGGRVSTLDAIKFAALDMAKAVYQNTGRELRALGIAVDEETFTKAAMMYVERTQQQAAEKEHAALPAAKRLKLIEEAGYFDGEIDDGGRLVPIRIAREDLIHG